MIVTLRLGICLLDAIINVEIKDSLADRLTSSDTEERPRPTKRLPSCKSLAVSDPLLKHGTNELLTPIAKSSPIPPPKERHENDGDDSF